MKDEYISTAELARRAGVSKQTVLRFARAGLITCGRKGLGKIRGANEYPARIAEEQLKRFRERPGIYIPPPAVRSSPGLAEVLAILRGLSQRIEVMEARLRTEIAALSRH